MYAKMDPKSIPKVIQNKCQNWYQKKIMKIIKKHTSLKGKIIEIHLKTSVFDGLEDCMREGCG